MDSVDFTKRPNWLEEIRQIEIKQLLQIWKTINVSGKQILDLGCGQDKYLKYLLNIDSSYYIGLDIIGNPDIKLDVKNIPNNMLSEYYVMSFGLFVYLPNDLKRRLLNNITSGLIQINRNDTNVSRRIDDFDLTQGIYRFGIDRNFISTLDNKFHIYENDICFFLVK